MNVNMDNQEICPSKMCNSQNRSGGCLLCDDDICLTCSPGYALFKGKCIQCDEDETCPFNNTDEVDCEGDDVSSCGGGDYTCERHVCVSGECKSGILGPDVECRLGGIGCRGCKCKKGWYPNNSDDCVSKCGDGNLTSDEECETGEGCDKCKCVSGWVSQGGLQCKPKCGDGIVVGNEECDGGDGCSGACKCVPGWYPNSDGNNSCHNICGDGISVGDEECDRGSGCGDDCQCLSGWYSE